MSGNRVFLVTGATGVIGSAIVPLLLKEAGATVHLLLRASSEDALGRRFQSLLDFWGDRVDKRDVPGRLLAVKGDVGRPWLGLNQPDYEALSATVTNVIHSAGNVSLNQPIEAARASAGFALEEIVRFARARGASGSPPKIEHLSTVGVAGRRPGLISEQRLNDGHGYHNTYEQAKAEAEKIILREIDRGLPVTIHRPSMVVGDSGDGRIIHFQVFYYLALFIAGSRTRGVLPQFGNTKLDLVPADYVAKVIVASARRADSAGKIFHLCSGPVRAMLLDELGEILRRSLSEHGERVFSPRYVPRGLFRVLLRTSALFSSAGIKRSLDSLPYFLDYLDEVQLFANERTSQFFARDALVAPAVEQFLPTVLDFWYRHRRATRALAGAPALEAGAIR